MGIAGLGLAIIKEDLLQKVAPTTPVLLDYKLMIDNDSMYNTPPAYAIYVLGLVLEWIDNLGGLEVMEERNIKKYLADTDIVLTQRFQDTDHIRPLQNNNKQTGNHSKPCNRKDQDKNNYHIHIQHIKPVKYHRIHLLYRTSKIGIPMTVLFLHQIEIQVFRNLVQLIVIIYKQFQSTDLILLPTVQPADLLNVSQNK